jgi:hypothetical protein
MTIRAVLRAVPFQAKPRVKGNYNGERKLLPLKTGILRVVISSEKTVSNL